MLAALPSPVHGHVLIAGCSALTAATCCTGTGATKPEARASARGQQAPQGITAAASELPKPEQYVQAPQGLYPAPLMACQAGPGTPGARSMDLFRLLGRSMAKALQDGRLLDLPLSYVFYRCDTRPAVWGLPSCVRACTWWARPPKALHDGHLLDLPLSFTFCRCCPGQPVFGDATLHTQMKPACLITACHAAGIMETLVDLCRIHGILHGLLENKHRVQGGAGQASGRP